MFTNQICKYPYNKGTKHLLKRHISSFLPISLLTGGVYCTPYNVRLSNIWRSPVCNGIMQGNDYFRSLKADRQKIWRLIGIIIHLYGANYVRHHVFSPSLNRLAQACGKDTIRKTTEKFVNTYLSNFCTFE